MKFLKKDLKELYKTIGALEQENILSFGFSSRENTAPERSGSELQLQLRVPARKYKNLLEEKEVRELPCKLSPAYTFSDFTGIKDFFFSVKQLKMTLVLFMQYFSCKFIFSL